MNMAFAYSSGKRWVLISNLLLTLPLIYKIRHCMTLQVLLSMGRLNIQLMTERS